MNNDDIYTIIGTDPGGHLGIGILYVDIYTLEIKKIDSTTITLEKYIKNDTMIDRLVLLENIIIKMYNDIQPAAVSMEVSFMNMKYPNAVMILTQYVSTIEKTWYNCNPFLKIYKYAPMYIKSKMSGTGKADKDDMRVAMSKNKELKKLVDLNNMSEHEVDAVSIAYTALLEIRDFRYYLWSTPL